MSQWLDEHRDLLSLVVRDLVQVGVKATGRQGLPAEAVLCCALLKQYRKLSYQELASHLEDAAPFGAFARLPLSWSPQKSVLQRTVSAIRSETWQQINRYCCPVLEGEARRRRGGAAGQHRDLCSYARVE